MRAAVFLVLLGGCTLFEDPPTKACKSDNDCFVAQGEKCNTDTKECEVPVEPDASPAQLEDEDPPLASEVER